MAFRVLREVLSSTLDSTCRSGFFHFVGDHHKLGEGSLAEGGGDGAVGGVSAGGHQDASDARGVVPRIEGPPAVAEINFEPGAEIHGAIRGRDADIAEVAGGVARGNVEGTAEGNGEMLKIAADANALGVNAQRRAGGTREFIAEGDVAVDPIANRQDAGPSFRHDSEQFYRGVHEEIDFAVAAAHQKKEHIGREFLDRNFLSVEALRVRQAGVVNQSGVVKANLPRRSDDAGAGVAETISETFDVSLRLGAHYVGFEQVGVAGRMDVEQRDNRNFGGDMELNVVSDPN
jgi:hypothetical protein